MARVTIDDSILTNIADAIRAKEGSEELIPTLDITDRILDLTTGGSDVEELELSFNEDSKVITIPCDTPYDDIAYISYMVLDRPPSNANEYTVIGCIFVNDKYALGSRDDSNKVHYISGITTWNVNFSTRSYMDSMFANPTVSQGDESIIFDTESFSKPIMFCSNRRYKFKIYKKGK